MQAPNTPDFLVATPGRLADLLKNHGLKPQLSQLSMLIFDEADQLLDMGFRPAIEEIIGLLPSRMSRQTLLFSATMPKDMLEIAKIALRPNPTFVDTVGEELNTHEHVPQQSLVTNPQGVWPELLKLLKEAKRLPGFKVIVFFPTARFTALSAELFLAMGVSVLEIHSRKSQSHRKRVSDTFRQASEQILFTSDVSARGMDYPDVTSVIQVGLPTDKAQYTHRLGRTSRGGNTGGNGTLLLCDFERNFLKCLGDQKMTERKPMAPGSSPELFNHVTSSMRKVEKEHIVATYQAYLGFYNSNAKGTRMSKEQIVATANAWVTQVCGLPEVPEVDKNVAMKVGLLNVAGLRMGAGGKGGKGKGKGKGGGKGGGKGKGGGGKGKGRAPWE